MSQAMRGAIIRALAAKGGNIYWTDEDLADVILAELQKVRPFWEYTPHERPEPLRPSPMRTETRG